MLRRMTPGRVRAVVALADEALEHLVLARHGLQLGQRLRLGDRRRQVHGCAARDAARHDAVDQRAARGLADHRQHVRFVGGVDADVAGHEFGGVLKLGQGRAAAVIASAWWWALSASLRHFAGQMGPWIKGKPYGF
jgi:hypothetical protein